MKVAIVGYGVEGKASYQYWLNKGDDVTIVDEKPELEDLPENAQTLLGPDVLQQLGRFDVVVRTPPLREERMKVGLETKIWSATNEFFVQCPAPIIGVTGTKGKGTTCTLIANILKAAGKTVHLVGNIGVPALEVFPNIKAQDFVVFELSSFQLWDLKKSPETAVVLMIEPDHMDVHASMAEYITAKANIATYQTEDDLLVFHPTNQYSAQIATTSPAHKKKRYLTAEGAYVIDGNITIEDNVICTTSEVGLIGAHNLENICAAITAAWRYTQDLSAIKMAVTTFKGLPHRLELAGEVEKVRYYDDSQATGVGSCLAALRAFAQYTVLILGGSDKGVDMTPIIQELDVKKHFVVLIGQSSDKIEALLKASNLTNYEKLGNQVTMTEIVNTAKNHARENGVVLLSPAHASFGMFKNYQDRGDQFKATVKSLQT